MLVYSSSEIKYCPNIEAPIAFSGLLPSPSYSRNNHFLGFSDYHGHVNALPFSTLTLGFSSARMLAMERVGKESVWGI